MPRHSLVRLEIIIIKYFALSNNKTTLPMYSFQIPMLKKLGLMHTPQPERSIGACNDG